MSESAISQRKADHLHLAAQPDAERAATARWSEIILLHNPLPEIDRAAIDLSAMLLGRRFAYPILISGMTGGHPQAGQVNRTLARVAEQLNIPMGLGSQRAMMNNPELAPSYTIAREVAPTAFLLANIGLPQLLPQHGTAPVTLPALQQALAAIEANALAVHLNFLQEAVQPAGDTNAQGGVAALRALTAALPVPVVVKETGAGLTAQAARTLVDCGVAALEVGGAGGTSFAAIEAERATAAGQSQLAAQGHLFADWGIPTPAAVRFVQSAGVPVIASGGIRNGLDAAKALALGADFVGLARPLLLAALQGEEATLAWFHNFVAELRTAMFLVGAATPAGLKTAPYLALGTTRTWLAEAAQLT